MSTITRRLYIDLFFMKAGSMSQICGLLLCQNESTCTDLEVEEYSTVEVWTSYVDNYKTTTAVSLVISYSHHTGCSVPLWNLY